MSDASDLPPEIPAEPLTNRPLIEPTKDEKMWAMLAHLSGMIAGALGGMTFLGPLIIWLVKKNESSFVDYHGKEALNFQISITVLLVLSIIVTIATCGIAFPLPLALGIFALVVTIMAAIKANNGEYYQYPLTIRFIK